MGQLRGATAHGGGSGVLHFIVPSRSSYYDLSSPLF
jgi:hypothetical protein